MKLTFELDGIQEGKNYTLDFCVSEDGSVKKTARRKTSKEVDKKNDAPNLEKFEENERQDIPKIEQPTKKKTMADFKVESSLGNNKIDESL